MSMQVTRTYLEMTSPDQLEAASVPEPAPQIARVNDCSVPFFRYLYQEVGKAYRWTDRLGWSDQQVRDYLAMPGVSIWLISAEQEPAGYFELRQHDDGSVEIAYFGLLPKFIGRGWGKYLLSRAVHSAWATGSKRVWLHTCTLDHPAALPNYIKRGFRPFRKEVFEVAADR
jgi:GNAT superfamily N-acetyltransferase